MLTRVHSLYRLLQSEASTAGLIFLLGARQTEGWRVHLRPVTHNACVLKCVFTNVMCLSLCECFFLASDPNTCRCWCHLLPCQSKARAECQSLRARQLTCISASLRSHCAPSTPGAVSLSHTMGFRKNNIHYQRKAGSCLNISGGASWSI